MNIHLDWQDVAIRLLAAVIAGGVLGYDRGARGHVAGLRTMMLMCLAAAGAMIEANLLLAVGGRTPGSFSTMDTLRFPLGILSGVGFIGAGAIVRKGKLVTGVTTAASLWLVTVIGLVLGAGYLALGAAMTAIALLILLVVKRAELRLRREHKGNLMVRLAPDGPSDEALQQAVIESGLEISSVAVVHAECRSLQCRVSWKSTEGADHIPRVVRVLSGDPGVLSVHWEPADFDPMHE